MTDKFRIDIKTNGLDQFKNKVRQLQSGMPAVIQLVALNSAKVVIKAAQPKVPTVSGAAAKSLRAYQTGQGAVAEGGGTVDYYRWLEKGGLAGIKHTVKRAITSDGRYIWPSYVEEESRIHDMMEQSLNKAVQDSGLA